MIVAETQLSMELERQGFRYVLSLQKHLSSSYSNVSTSSTAQPQFHTSHIVSISFFSGPALRASKGWTDHRSRRFETSPRDMVRRSRCHSVAFFPRRSVRRFLFHALLDTFFPKELCLATPSKSHLHLPSTFGGFPSNESNLRNQNTSTSLRPVELPSRT